MALYWDGSYEIAKALMARHRTAKLDELTLQQIFEWTVALPEFADDPTLVNDDFLSAILQDWFEEVNPL